MMLGRTCGKGAYYDGTSGTTTYQFYDVGFRVAGLEDCNENGFPDECEMDCATGGRCDVPGCGLASDCNGNGILDDCDIAECPGGDPRCDDCNENLFPDSCDFDPSDPDGNGQVSDDCDGNSVPEGSAGEVVVTPLVVEGMPLIRFRTGDVSMLLTEECPCGRMSPRLGPIIGRKNQMMKVRGTTLYPQAVYSALDETPEVSEYYMVVTGKEDLSDEITIHVAVRDGSIAAETVADALQARLRVKPAVVVEPEEAVRQHVYSPKSRKPIRFTDNRNQQQ